MPFYKTDALCRRNDTKLYDDRDIIKCNLLRAYERLMDFCRRHLPEWPVIEGVQRKSLREVIFREVCLNTLIHREFAAHHDASFTIWSNRVEVMNWNIPFGFGPITLNNLRPHAKNPTIANFFAQMGIVEELGTGIRTIFRYVPQISGGQDPLIEEQDEFKVVIPYIGNVVKDVVKQLTERQGIILKMLTENNKLSATDLSQRLNVTSRTVQRDLLELQSAGYLERGGGRKDGCWIVK